ncbi:hypothetical protein L1049_016405 [Liquidambar formosana]|uniref:Protein kinase domain-containing protein n=1 Tax=Liquidambar formosana TaxID=63359 RepID=A0AAP0S6A8_LIQFO
MKRKQEPQLHYGDGKTWLRGSMIGQGTFGCVYLATLKKPNSRYSYLPPTMAVKSAEVSVSASLQKEIEVLYNLQGCHHVVNCFAEEITSGEHGEMIYNLLLEYASGGTLADLIEKSDGCGLPEFVVRRYVRSMIQQY